MTLKLKLIIFLSLSILVVTGLIFNVGFSDDVHDIKEVVIASQNDPSTEVIHIEFLNDRKAIAFYERATHEYKYFGNVALQQKLFNWQSAGGSASYISKDYPLNWTFSNLEKQGFNDYTDLLSGKITDPKIDVVQIKTKNDNEYEAQVIEYRPGEKFWFFVSDGENLIGSTVTGLSKAGEIIDEITG
ncbi:hypothetical protein LGQ02_01735 [Bacillus shivajii]|uniref:hypothetical protein n=1 Tax=Bacillus shivajii TaxID=1983719 RepID=UPI001CF9DFE4|nr:hypothetical protein [Bacillus shivajii]UCZ53544.1 hypothetical protein LGQ02_01735 [Bacillus shivajii]